MESYPQYIPTGMATDPIFLNDLYRNNPLSDIADLNRGLRVQPPPPPDYYQGHQTSQAAPTATAANLNSAYPGPPSLSFPS